MEKISEAKIVTDEEILVLLCEGGGTSLVSPELYVSLIPQKKGEGTARTDICTMLEHFDGLVVKGKGLSSRSLGSVHQFDPLTGWGVTGKIPVLWINMQDNLRRATATNSQEVKAISAWSDAPNTKDSSSNGSEPEVLQGSLLPPPDLQGPHSPADTGLRGAPAFGELFAVT